MNPSIPWANTAALFGGAFDPPHLGHTLAIQEIVTHLSVPEVVVIPTALSHLKENHAPATDRYRMCELAFGTGPRSDTKITIDRLEIERYNFSKFPTPSYTYDTLKILQTRYREKPAPLNIAFVLGSDQLSKFQLWHRFPDILGLSHWLVLTRQPDGLAATIRSLNNWTETNWIEPVPSSDSMLWHVCDKSTYLQVLPASLPEISSSQIREAIAQTGKPPQQMLTDPVAEYIAAHKLYSKP